jgi:hypothetical protein
MSDLALDYGRCLCSGYLLVVLLVELYLSSSLVSHVHIVSRYVFCCHIESSMINEFDFSPAI